MPHKQNAPFVVRWLNGVKDDPNPALSSRALTAAAALARYADVKTGHNCFPSTARCARDMRVSEDTIERGLAELAKAGWLERKPMSGRRRLKVLRWPGNHPLTAGQSPADSGTTFTGNQRGLSAPPGEASQPGKQTGTCAGCGGPLGYLLEGDGPTDGALCLACFRAS